MQEKYLNLLNNGKNGITFLSILLEKSFPKTTYGRIFIKKRVS